MKKGTKIICIILGVLIILGFIFWAVNYIKIRYIEKNVFNAKIEKITEYEGITTVLIEGLDTNDINHRGKFDFVVTEKTKLLWRGTKIQLSDLKVGQTISITAAQEVLLKYPAGLTGVTKVTVLDDEL